MWVHFTRFGANESDNKCTGEATTREPPRRREWFSRRWSQTTALPLTCLSDFSSFASFSVSYKRVPAVDSDYTGCPTPPEMHIQTSVTERSAASLSAVSKTQRTYQKMGHCMNRTGRASTWQHDGYLFPCPRENRRITGRALQHYLQLATDVHILIRFP